MSRNKAFDEIFLSGSFDNGLVDGTAFAERARPVLGQDDDGNPMQGRFLETGESALTRK